MDTHKNQKKFIFKNPISDKGLTLVVRYIRRTEGLKANNKSIIKGLKICYGNFELTESIDVPTPPLRSTPFTKRDST